MTRAIKPLPGPSPVWGGCDGLRDAAAGRECGIQRGGVGVLVGGIAVSGGVEAIKRGDEAASRGWVTDSGGRITDSERESVIPGIELLIQSAHQ